MALTASWASVALSPWAALPRREDQTCTSWRQSVPVVPAVDCATREKDAGNCSSSPCCSDGANNISRRGAVLAGVAALTGAGGINLLFTPTIGATETKQTRLPIEDLKKIIEADITQRQYPVTGNLTESIYDENCRFQDPITDVTGLKKYVAALQVLFDPASSKHEILNIKVTGPHTIEQNWSLRGYIKLPWRPYVPPYEGITTYTTDDSGLIVSHAETWSISALTAVTQFLTPSWLSKDAPK